MKKEDINYYVNTKLTEEFVTKLLSFILKEYKTKHKHTRIDGFNIIEDDKFKKDCYGYIEENSYIINLRKSIVDNVSISNDEKKLFKLLEIFYHEIEHLEQRYLSTREGIYDIDITIMNIEAILHKANRRIYNVTYSDLMIELDANLIGYQNALEFMNKYSYNFKKEPDFTTIVNYEYLKKRKNEHKFDNMSLIDTDDSFTILLYLASIYIIEHKEILNQIPDLKKIFNQDGSLKDVHTLIIDKEKSKKYEYYDKVIMAVKLINDKENKLHK